MKAHDYVGRRNISGDRIREARVKHRYSQSALAAKMQCEGVLLEQDAISRIEKGTRMVQDFELRALASLLGVTADWLLSSEKYTPQNPSVSK